MLGCALGARLRRTRNGRSLSYNAVQQTYNDEGSTMTNSYVMRVSSNGQVSIPADARTRWKSERVVVVDLGDRVVIRPLPADPLEPMIGKYRGRGPTTDRARRTLRREDAERDRPKRR